MVWTTRRFEFRFPRPALVMGIINVTPDSFSDGGRYLSAKAAVAHGLELVRLGADILDVGGESSRPGAEPVPEEEELRRVIPVIEQLASAVVVPISIDTVKPRVAQAALQAGASIVNDVAAHRTDPELWHVVARFGAGYIAMHMQGTPRSMQKSPHYENVCNEVADFLKETLGRLVLAGIDPDQVAVDPGIGFGKRPEHNLELLASMAVFRQTDRPRVVGVSRKSFVGDVTGAPVSNRLPGSLAATCLARQQGTEIFRTHDVAETVQALRVTEAIVDRYPPN